MGERRALVIGAPNDRFGRLTFLDDVVGELHRVVRHPEFGGCAPALPDGRDLLLGAAATRSAMNSALGDAMRAAADDQATLFVYFCGHGYREEPDFYLVASDTEPGCVDSETALPLGQRVKELLRQNATVDGLMLIIDACHSGGLVADPVTGLLREGVHGRIEFLAATRPKQVASKGCFSRSLTARLLAGSPGSPSPEIRAYDEHHRLRDVAPEECRDMPQVVHLSLNGSSDAGLWLGRNRTADLCPALVGTASADLVARLTRDWQRPLSSQLRLMVLLGQCASPIGITGGPGAGKSAFLAWLGRRSAGDLLWLDALVLVRPGDTLALLAPRLEIQLRNVAAYRAAAQRWRQLTPVLHQQAASDFDRQITGPLSHLDTASQVRIGIDAADQLDTVQRRRLLDAVASLPGVAVLLTGRQLDEVPGSATIDLPDRDADGVARLLTAVIDDGTVRKQVADLVSGEWLLARVLTGLWRAGHLPAASPLTKLRDLHAAFNAAITTAQSASPGAPVDEVLSLLAAAPTGAWLPLQVISATLEKADARSPNPSVRRDPEATIVRVRDAVVALGELVARAEPGQTTERIGPAHDLIATYLADRYGDVAVKDAHMAIAESLRAIAPDADPAHGRSYARARLSEHLAACGRTAEALVQLPVLSRPADTLALWNSWHDRIAPLDELRIEVLTTRYNIAHWTGAAGNPAEAVRLLEQLLPEQQRVLGPDHPDVLTTQRDIAYLTGLLRDR